MSPWLALNDVEEWDITPLKKAEIRHIFDLAPTMDALRAPKMMSIPFKLEPTE